MLLKESTTISMTSTIKSMTRTTRRTLSPVLTPSQVKIKIKTTKDVDAVAKVKAKASALAINTKPSLKGVDVARVLTRTTIQTAARVIATARVLVMSKAMLTAKTTVVGTK